MPVYSTKAHEKRTLSILLFLFFSSLLGFFLQSFAERRGKKKDMTAFTAFCLGAKRSNCMSCLLCTSSLRNWRPFYYGSFFLCVCVLSFSLFFFPFLSVNAAISSSSVAHCQHDLSKHKETREAESSGSSLCLFCKHCRHLTTLSKLTTIHSSFDLFLYSYQSSRLDFLPKKAKHV